jgi:hypothetical protein
MKLFINLEAKTKKACSFILKNGNLYFFKKIVSKTKKSFNIEITSTETGASIVIDIDKNYDYNVKFN